MPFKPGLVPTAFMVFGVALTASLSVWQFNRFQQKEAFRQDVLAGLDQPVITAADLDAGLDDVIYRKVAFEGRFVDPMVLTAARMEFGRSGYGVVQPFAIDGGPLVLVDRGWIPRDGLAEALPQVETTDATTTLYGQLRPFENQVASLGCSGEARTPTGPLPPQEGRPETWPPGSWAILADRLPVPHLDAIVLAGEPILAGEGKRPEPLPVSGYNPLPPMRDSLSYAGFWALAGLMLIVVWIGLGISRARDAAADGGRPTSGRAETSST